MSTSGINHSWYFFGPVGSTLDPVKDLLEEGT